MKIIFVSDRKGTTRTFNLGKAGRFLLIAGLAGICTLSGWFSHYLTRTSLPAAIAEESLTDWREALTSYQSELAKLRAQSRQETQALTLRLAQLQARLTRLDALGERLTDVAKLDADEFDFGQPPALGGPIQNQPEDDSAQVDFATGAMEDLIAEFDRKLDDRERQLDFLENLLRNRQVEESVYLEGRPIKKGWMSSGYGYRADPFHGKRAWHAGMDFAGKEGSEVIAVASGLVTWSGERHGYGQMVEVNHGGGFSTRYAHNKENRVKVGDVVSKGQTLAVMGSSGRSTGPHVHFEVYKHGKSVNPSTYIYRKRH
jgi:murein DD-endopeptidase MepM/ murein hydrolase activator NlpD